MLIRISLALVFVFVVALPVSAWADFGQDKQRCLDPNPDIRISRCTRLIQSGQFSGTNLSILLYDRGNAYGRKRQYDRAIQDYTEAIRLKPDYARAFNNRGLSYGRKRQYDRAIRDFTEAIRLRPDYTSAYYKRGLAYGRKRQYDRAIQDYTEAIRLKPNYASAYGGRGYAKVQLGKRDKAIADFRKAIELRPGDRMGTLGLKSLGVTP
ncbi:MAG: tetratricopeptide repeat protein [Proteobacteria bacterium]|nr:tetratricopeptide repeat protein [Pseudomonadota bacterium]